MANHCDVNMRLRVSKTNATGMLNVLNALMPDNKDTDDFSVTMKKVAEMGGLTWDGNHDGLESINIYRKWFQIGFVGVIDSNDEENILVEVAGYCGWSVKVSMLHGDLPPFLKNSSPSDLDKFDLEDLCGEYGVDFSIASAEPGLDFLEQYNFIDGEMVDEQELPYWKYCKDRVATILAMPVANEEREFFEEMYIEGKEDYLESLKWSNEEIPSEPYTLDFKMNCVFWGADTSLSEFGVYPLDIPHRYF